MRHAIQIVALGLLVFLIGCQRELAQPPALRSCELRIPESVPTDKHPRIYTVQADESEVRMFAYRSGKLASLGHNHVVVSNELHGTVYVHDDIGKSGMDVVMPLASLIVDQQQHRAQAGEEFSTKLSPDVIAGTKRNMLKKVLDATNYPEVRVTAASTKGKPDNLKLVTCISLNGEQREMAVPVDVRFDDRQLIATGEMEISQTAFGVTPYSVMLGALAVHDIVKVKYRIVAQAKLAE